MAASMPWSGRGTRELALKDPLHPFHLFDPFLKLLKLTLILIRKIR
jgi:hypothetical protein